MKIKYIVALMTVIATAGGCTQDTGEQPEEAVPIRLAATIAPTDAGKTRAFGVWGGAATTQDTELLTGQTVRAWISENDGSHTAAIKDPIEYTVSNAAGDLEPVNTTTDPAFYYPQGVDVISIHAIHPSGYASGGTFTVNTDQTTEANYAASDLCYSMPANFARTDVDANGRKLLQMKHLLSKIVVNLTLDPNLVGVATLPASIKLHAKTSTTMTYPVDPSIDANCYTGCTASDASNPGIITMIQEAIIPPQTIAAGASFLSFSVTGIGPMIYPMPAATTFESGKMYTYNIRVKNVGITVTTTVTNWGTKVDNQVVRAQIMEDIKRNPLWYVAEYNILDADGTTLATTENAGYFFTWTDAMTKFTGSTTSISEYTRGNNSIVNTPSGSTWHLPTRSEWWSIVPSGRVNLASIKSYSGLTTISDPIVFGYNSTTKEGIEETSWWNTISQTETRAIRFLGTEYCSAWKYVWANNILTISATLIDVVEKNATAASTWYNSHSWDGTGENAIIFGNNEEALAVQRSFYSRGHGVDASGPTGTVQVNLHVLHWSSTEISDDYSTDNDAWRLQCVVNNYYSVSYGGGANGKNYLSFCIRLFRDN